MGKTKTTFKKGDKIPSRKGKPNKTTEEARNIFLQIMSNQVDQIEENLTKVAQNDPAKYLDVLSKLFPYFMPKQVDITTKGEALQPVIIDFSGSSEDKTD